jgi:predicted phosphoribosyltransferase
MEKTLMFENREDGARHLVGGLKVLDLRDPVVLAIPHGGIVIGAVVARQLRAELDVVLVHKLRSPDRADLTIGAVAEDGEVCLNHWIELVSGIPQAYIERERQRQLQEINRRQRLFRAARPAVEIAGRSVIVVDDGVITGATILAALHAVKAKAPYETIVAVPVGPPDRLKVIAGQCNQLVCALAPPNFYTIGQHYRSFEPVQEEDVATILREFAPVSQVAS